MKNFVKTFESFINDMEFPKDCEVCGEVIYSSEGESPNYEGMCLMCDTDCEDTCSVNCDVCGYEGPMIISNNSCPKCLGSSGLNIQPIM